MKTQIDEIVTSDLSQFGSRERDMLIELLTSWRVQGLPSDFDDDQVIPMMNKNSGNVFLTNSNYDVAMMNGNKLESFYSCHQCGHEGFLEEMDHDGNSDCEEYVKEIKERV
jgi:hypothetical protein